MRAMKGLAALAVIVALNGSVMATTYPNSTPTVVTCTETSACTYHQQATRSGNRVGCIAGGTQECNTADCVWGAWKWVDC
jgi:hypothetical protein